MTYERTVITGDDVRRFWRGLKASARRLLGPGLIVAPHLLLALLVLLPFEGSGPDSYRPGYEIGFAGWVAIPTMLIVGTTTFIWWKQRTRWARRLAGVTNLLCLLAVPVGQWEFRLGEVETTLQQQLFWVGWCVCLLVAVIALIGFFDKRSATESRRS